MQLNNLSNNELLEEIKRRFDERDGIISDSKIMMKNLEEINKKLAKSEENRSKFMSIIKNEFNNPLFSMMSLSKSLIRSSNDERVALIGNSLYEESLMLNFQIKNVIIAAEIESGTIDIQNSKISFQDIVLQIKEELQYPINHKKVKLEITITSPNEIYLDREKLYLILLNLLSNAIEFSPENSHVKLTIAESEEAIHITIQDNGEGIEPSEYENIYKRFHQAHSGMNRIHRGQGLGLSVVRDLVGLLDGEISFTSELRKQTTFDVIIPKQAKDGCSLFDDDDFMFNMDDDGGDAF